MSRKQSNFGSGTAKPKNFPAREDVLVTRISGGVISGPAINGRDKMVCGGGPRRKRSIFDDGPKQSKTPRRKIFK